MGPRVPAARLSHVRRFSRGDHNSSCRLDKTPPWPGQAGTTGPGPGGQDEHEQTSMCIRQGPFRKVCLQLAVSCRLAGSLPPLHPPTLVLTLKPQAEPLSSGTFQNSSGSSWFLVCSGLLLLTQSTPRMLCFLLLRSFLVTVAHLLCAFRTLGVSIPSDGVPSSGGHVDSCPPASLPQAICFIKGIWGGAHACSLLCSQEDSMSSRPCRQNKTQPLPGRLGLGWEPSQKPCPPIRVHFLS